MISGWFDLHAIDSFIPNFLVNLDINVVGVHGDFALCCTEAVGEARRVSFMRTLELPLEGPDDYNHVSE